MEEHFIYLTLKHVLLLKKKNFEACPVIPHLCAFCCHPFGHFYIEHGLLFISKIHLMSYMGYMEELNYLKHGEKL